MSTSADDLSEAVATLGEFLARTPLTSLLATLEDELEGADARAAAKAAKSVDVDEGLLQAALVARDGLGRISDVIHASVIVLVLPQILGDGETVSQRPSLGAGNDPSRPFDLETDARVAEFKVSKWKGSDASRKRETFKDLVNLAADQSGRRAQLFVVGDAPVRFLRTTRAKAGWGLDRAPATRRLFEGRFGPLTMPIKDFTSGPGSHVEILNLAALLPVLLDKPPSQLLSRSRQ